ncbi:MAG: large repetitive protein [Clostridiales bacterium]|nr:large repetitive protein [Clostridiales bacterium]
MKILRHVLSLLLVVLLTAEVAMPTAWGGISYAETGTMTNGSKVVDLDALKAIIDDDTDSNGDGLPDQLKRMLGLDTEKEDTNGDGISDKFKLENGLDPLKSDTYDIGVSDLYALTKGDSSISLTPELLEEDLDEDGLPDIRDKDLENDQLNNGVDLSPLSQVASAEQQTIKITTSGKATDFKVQLQPADLESLKENSRVMTWPIDIDGQMTNFDGSEDTVKIVPMLEVTMDTYPDQETLDEWGYLVYDEQLYVPLQYLEDEYSPVGLSGTLHLPAEMGTLRDDGKYDIEITLKLSWLMVAQTYNITNQWEPFAKVESLNTYSVPVWGPGINEVTYEERTAWENVALDEVKTNGNREYLGSEIGALNDNDTPDMMIYWTEENGVYEKIYYDLTYDTDLNVYRAADESDPIYAFEFEGTSQRQKSVEPDPDSDLTRVNNSKYTFYLDDESKKKAIYYEVDDDNQVIKVVANDQTYGAKRTLTIDEYGYFEEKDTSSYSLFTPLPEPRKYSDIRDMAFKSFPDENYPATFGTVWLLYEAYNEDTGMDELVLNLDITEDGSDGVQQTEVLINDLPADSQDELSRYISGNGIMQRGLSVLIRDLNEDGNDDLIITDRTGRMFAVMDAYGGEGWTDRMYQLSDGRSVQDVIGQNTIFYDMDGDGEDEMVGIQAIQADNNWGSVDLNFQISQKDNLEKTTKILMKDYEGFAITGMQVEEHQGIDTTLITGENTEDLVYMAALFHSWYLQGNYTMDEVVDDYITEVLDGDSTSIDEVKGSYGYFFEALLDIGQQIESNEDWKNFDGPKPMIILTWDENKLLNLDELDEDQFTGDGIVMDVSDKEVITGKQLILKWIEDGATLSPDEISEMVDNNPEDLYEFREDPEGSKDTLSLLNLGELEIIGIGDDIIESEPTNVYKEVLQDWFILTRSKDVVNKLPVLSKYVTKLLVKADVKFLKAPVQNIGSDAIYKIKLARYNKFMGIMRKTGISIQGAGLMVDVAVSVYSGVLYGMAMAKIGGVGFGIVTGITYGGLVLAYSLLTLQLVLMGPGGWVIVGLLYADTLVATLVDGYDGVIGMSMAITMALLYDSKVYPGTKIEYIGKTDDADKNGRVISGGNYGYAMGAEVVERSQYQIDIKGADPESPANSSNGLADSWVDLNIYNNSNTVDTDNQRDISRDDIVKEGAYWYRHEIWDFENTLNFNTPGINLAVSNNTSFYYRLISSVRVNRYVVYETEKYEYAKNTIRSSSVDYYDVMPESLEMFWSYFNFIDTDADPDHAFPVAENNEIAYWNPYYDSNGDGIPDRVKEDKGLDIHLADTDGDGLTDFEELNLNLDPLKTDTDEDGVDDYTEVNIPVGIVITTSLGSVSAQAYSDPLKADTSGDGHGDQQKREDGLNPASRHTNGSVLFDYNLYAPECIQPFDDIETVDLTTLEFNLSDYVSDGDDDIHDLQFTVSHGELSEDDSGNIIWTYRFDMSTDGRYADVSLQANDLKGGILDVSFLVYDESGPVIESLRAHYDDGTYIDPLNLETFEEALPSNPTFYTLFNKPIDFDNMDKSRIVIEPLGDRAYLDTDETFVPNDTAVDIHLLDSDTFKEIDILRPDPIVENGIEYRLYIPGDAVTDRATEDPYPMDKDYEVHFYTEDNESPRIKEIRYGLDGSGTAWDMTHPLVIEFNEDVILGDNREFPLADGADSGSYIPQTVPGVHRMEQVDSRTIQVEIASNYLDNDTYYQLVRDFGLSDARYAHYDIRDLAGNYYDASLEPMATTRFTTGDVMGLNPNIYLNSTYECYEMDTWYSANRFYMSFYNAGQLGEISENIYPGPEFDNIFVTYDFSIFPWNKDLLKEDIKASALPATFSISGDKLIVTVEKGDFALVNNATSYTVYIPSKALVDANGNYIHNNLESSGDSDIHTKTDSNLNLYNDFMLAVRVSRSSDTTIDFVTEPEEKGHLSVLKSMINYPTGNEDLVKPAGTYMAVLTNLTGALTSDKVSLWALDESGTEQYQIPVTIAHTGAFRVLYFTPMTPLDVGGTYKLKIASYYITPTASLPNPATEMTFTVTDSLPNDMFSGGNHMDVDNFVGTLRVDEVIAVKGEVSKYYDMFNDRGAWKEDLLTYQWYIGDTENASEATLIPGANQMFYVPETEDEGKYLFLALQVDYTGLDDYIPEDLRVGSTTFELMSPALGPIQSAFFASTALQDIVVESEASSGTNLLTHFNNSTHYYEIEVPPETKSVTVLPKYDEALNSFVSINSLYSQMWKDAVFGGELQPDGLEIPIDMGENTIYVSSRAENFVDEQIFEIRIIRKALQDGDIQSLAPEAQYVRIDNDNEYFVGETLIGAYTYHDDLQRAESGTTYQWYRHSEDNAESRVPIAGATEAVYTLTNADVGKYISFEVTPKAENSVAGTGELSWWIGSVRETDSVTSSIINIQVKYDGTDLLNDYDAGTKTYDLAFASGDVRTVAVEISGGSGVTINGTPGTSAEINFDETRLIEVVSDGTSYFITLDDRPLAAFLGIEGEESVEVSESFDKTVMWEAQVYDQYGDAFDADVVWTVPEAYTYSVSGSRGERLLLTVPSSAELETLTIEAHVKNKADVLEEKPLTITGDPLASLTSLEENAVSDFSPAFDPDVYDYTLDDVTEAEIAFTATLDGATITYAYDDQSRGSVEEAVVSGETEVIRPLGGTNDVVLTVEKTGYRKATYTITVTKPDGAAPIITDIEWRNVTSTSAQVIFISDEAGTYYYVNQEATAEDFTDAEALKVAADGDGSALAGTETAIQLSGLTIGTTYETFVVVEDSSGNLSEVSKVTYTTSETDTATPVITDIEWRNVTATSAQIIFISDKAGTYYYVNQETTLEDITDAEALKAARNGSGDASEGTETTIQLSDLTAETDYETFVAVEDGSGNLSEVSKVSFTTATSDGDGGSTDDGEDTPTPYTPPNSHSYTVFRPAPPQQQQEDDGDIEQTGDGVVITPPAPKMDEATGTERWTISPEVFERALSQAGTERPITLYVNLSSGGTTGRCEVALPQSALYDFSGLTLRLQTPFGDLILSGDMLSGNAPQGTGTVVLSIGRETPSSGEEDAGERIALVFEENGLFRTIGNEEKPIGLALPYVLQPGEDPERVVVRRILDDGTTVPVPDARYDAETGMIAFESYGSATYRIEYGEKTFEDLSGFEWARQAIEVMAAKGILNGTSENLFSPGASITRADYLTLLVATLNLRAPVQGNFDDVLPGAYYYESVGIARALGIVSGSGSNAFEPNQTISRQDMMVMTAKALEQYSTLSADEKEAMLGRFSDRSEVSDYASDSIAWLLFEGLLSGSDGKINPESNSTRAEAAVFLYKIYSMF